MDNYTDKVADFYDAFGEVTGTPVAEDPCVPEPAIGLARIAFLAEEVAELAYAFSTNDKVEILDALVDIQYFLSGTVLACGMADVFEDAFDEVHYSNMDKLGPDGRPILTDVGRVGKPEGWHAPDLAQFVGDNSDKS